jgi:hypothetical protein
MNCERVSTGASAQQCESKARFMCSFIVLCVYFRMGLEYIEKPNEMRVSLIFKAHNDLGHFKLQSLVTQRGHTVRGIGQFRVAGIAECPTFQLHTRARFTAAQ